jgi:hypothetical protein
MIIPFHLNLQLHIVTDILNVNIETHTIAVMINTVRENIVAICYY